MVKDDGKRPNDYGDEPEKAKKVKKVKTEGDKDRIEENNKTRPLEDSQDQSKIAAKKSKLINCDWGLGKGWSNKKINKYQMTKEEFFDYIRNHKTLSTTNLIDIRGYGNNY
ncbi:uncharacterized protein LOC128397198 [Panonychus citri]|uniref:uncharacterized protein LOC128397198 n=1 Tax=Panonychus citri TaxID=50023 RepID=UPI002307AEB5|nr:uncharacterized protein LOC128397198 [Panonychus citri]